MTELQFHKQLMNIIAPKKGRRAGGPSSSRDESGSTEDLLDSPPSSSFGISGKFSRGSLQSPDETLRTAPPRSKKTGGWAEESTKSGKRRSSSNLIEQERFRATANDKDDSDDDIPVIPDLEDLQDDVSSTIADAPLVSINRITTYKDLDSDLFKHAAFASLEEVNLQLLTKCLSLEADVQEADEQWNWDFLFTNVVPEIHREWELVDELGNGISSLQVE